MIYAVSAVFAEIFFLFINIVWMRLRRLNVSTRSILAIYIFSTPILLCIASYQIWLGRANLSGEYWFYIAAWIVFCALENLVNIYMFKFSSLTQLSVFRFVFSAILAFISDIFVLDTLYSGMLLFFMALTFGAGIVLNIERTKYLAEKETQCPKQFKAIHFMFLVFLVSLFSVGDFTFYKIALQIQNNIVFHVAAAESLLFLTFFSYGGQRLFHDISHKNVRISHIACIVLFGLIAIFLEGYSLISLPVALIILLSVIRPFIFAVHDMGTHDLPFNFRSVVACGTILIGIVGIVFFQNS